MITRAFGVANMGSSDASFMAADSLIPRNPSLLNRRVFHADASIVLVGCRGAGKRTLGFIGAGYLHRRLLTEDHYFEQATGCNRAKFLEQYGKEAFQSQMATTLAQVLQTHPTNCIIECGLGILSKETKEILRQFSETNPVIYVHRERNEICKILKLPTAETDKLLQADRRHRDCTNLEYYNLLDGGDSLESQSCIRSVSTSSARLLQVKEDFTKFLDLITGRGATQSWVENPFSINAIPPEHRLYSFVLRLRLSYLLNQGLDLERLESGGDAVELVIDTWPENLLEAIAMQVSLIRRKLDLPIIYHVEENPREERQRTPEERDAEDLKLLQQGLRLGVDYLSLDLERDEQLIIQTLCMRGRTKIIGNFTLKGFTAPMWSDDSYTERYMNAKALGCNVVRFARFCAGNKDDALRAALLKRIDELPEPKPVVVTYDFSVFGAVNDVLDAKGPSGNPQGLTFAPVGHEAISPSAREHLAGVNTVRGCLRNMFRHGLLQPLKFYTLGSKVYYSASPAMHRAGYELLMMPHTFDARQCTELDEVERIRCEPDFGGACLTAPFKVAMLSRVDHLSTHATAIGAVNTLLPLRGHTSSILDHANARNRTGATSKFYGDNTDWSAITTCLRRAISPRNAVQPSRTTGLVIGAGGMARAAIYALIKLGCRKIFIYNRTRANAETVAEHFNQWAQQYRLVRPQDPSAVICRVLDSAAQEWPAGYQQPTMIVSCVASAGDLHDATVEFRLPPQWLKSPTGGVVVEVWLRAPPTPESPSQTLTHVVAAGLRAPRDRLDLPNAQHPGSRRYIVGSRRRPRGRVRDGHRGV